jgi:hypothetical protein
MGERSFALGRLTRNEMRAVHNASHGAFCGRGLLKGPILKDPTLKDPTLKDPT